MNLVYSRALPSISGYFHPSTVKSAISLLDKYRRGAKVLAGGTDILVSMRTRNSLPRYLVDISGITKLNYIKFDSKGLLKLGPLVTIRDVELSEIIGTKYQLLREAAFCMGTIQVNNLATIIGNICRASPAGDMAPPLLVLEAKVKISGPDRNRVIPLSGFFIGPGKTILKYNEMVTEIQIPVIKENVGTAFLRLTRVASDLAKVSVAAAVEVKGGIFNKVKIALGSVAPKPIRAENAESFLLGKSISDETIEKAADLIIKDIKPIDDVRSSKDYRKEVSKILVAKAIEICINRAKVAGR
ncbi:MAG: xanthine dehydrogenase family protein subunit M [Dehalococcoidia bacterium]|nr:MAG: xanthine dehydrogenase family protein subunit M [Dehalococcoidia bacterium]